MNPYAPLLPDQDFHIVQRAVGFEKLFFENENYRFFLQQYTKYIVPYMHTIAYCLLPNHFHFVIRTKNLEELSSLYKNKFPNRTWSDELCSDLLMQQWSNLLNSYTKSFNKKYDRKGGLFIDCLKRVLISSETQFCATVFYVHRNPVHHDYCKKMQEWRYSSYTAYLEPSAHSLLAKDIAFEYFEDLKDYILYHQQPIYLKEAVELE